MPTFVPEVQLWLGNQFVQIVGADSKDVLARDSLTVGRGRSDWSSQVQPSRATMSLKNAAGKYSPRHPGSPYFGQVGRNIPVKVFMDGRCRFHGEVSEWPQRADPDRYVPIEGGGVLRRLSAPDPDPLRSVLYRTLLTEGNLQRPVAYWPCEEESSAARFYSAVGRNNPIRFSSVTRLASFSGFPSSAPIPTIGNAQFYADIAPHANNTTMTAMCLVHLPDDSVAADDTALMTANTTGSARYWRIRVNINRTLNLQVADASGANISTTIDTSFTIAPEGAILLLELNTSGANVNWNIRVLNYGRSAAQIVSNTVSGRSYNRIPRLTFGSGTSLGDTAIGQVALFTGTVDDTILLDALNAHIGETAGRRAERLCREEKLPFVSVGDLDDTARMGPQGMKSLIDLLTEVASADAGMLYEPFETTKFIGDFEDGTTQGWAATGGSPAALASVTTRAWEGTHSLRITWASSTSNVVQFGTSMPWFVTGNTYIMTARVWVPTGDVAVSLRGGSTTGTASNTHDQWQLVSVQWVAGSTDETLAIVGSSPASGDQVFVDDVRVESVSPGLGYRTRSSLYNIGSTLTLNFDANQVGLPFEPTDDDQLLANDVSVTRDGGATFRTEITTGDLSISKVGRRRASGTYSVETDEVAQQLSAWQAHLGTWNEMRVPQLTVSLTRNPALAAAACAVDLGHRITLTNPPDWLPPDVIELMAQGSNEDLDSKSWKIVFNSTPYRPYQVVRLDSGPVKKITAFDSVLNAGINASVLSFAVKSLSGLYLWTTDAAQFPIPITVDGEDMTVTNITGTTSPQTFTVTRGANGYPASHLINAVVQVRDRATLAL